MAGRRVTPPTRCPIADGAQTLISRRRAVFLLNFVAGWVDGVGFLALVGTVQAFPSFMSGNSTKFVTDIVSGKFQTAAAIGGVVLAFIIGTIFARLLNDGSRRRETAALICVAVCLGVTAAGAAMGWSKNALLLLLAFAMGSINRALQGKDGYTVHTFISGAVVTIGSDIADAISGRGPWKQALLPLSIWGSILFGAGVGGLMTLKVGLFVGLAVPALAVILLAAANGIGWLEASRDPRDGHPPMLSMHG
nr:YoaK family protein [Aurantiacibacter rhizosphaerae]